jgi:hypothetical protein
MPHAVLSAFSNDMRSYVCYLKLHCDNIIVLLVLFLFFFLLFYTGIFCLCCSLAEAENAWNHTSASPCVCMT